MFKVSIMARYTTITLRTEMDPPRWMGHISKQILYICMCGWGAWACKQMV